MVQLECPKQAFSSTQIIGWRYDITAGGIVRTPPVQGSTEVELSLRNIDYFILYLLLGVSLGIFHQLTVQIKRSGTAIDPPET